MLSHNLGAKSAKIMMHSKLQESTSKFCLLSYLTLKGSFLLFQVYRNFAILFSKLSVSTFYKEISKCQQKVQSEKN